MPPAALAERRPQWKIAHHRSIAAIEHIARRIDAGKFQIAAADRAEQSVARDHHLAAGLTWCGAARGKHGHQYRRFAGAIERSQRIQPGLHHSAALAVGTVATVRRCATASKTASGVAGAFRCNGPSPVAAIASLIAWNTDMPSISGGSPTAFDR